jgi:hypothetical protein
MAAIGWLLQRGILERSARGGVLTPILSTFGLAIVIENLLFERFGAESLVGPTVAITITRELAPVLSALMITMPLTTYCQNAFTPRMFRPFLIVVTMMAPIRVPATWATPLHTPGNQGRSQVEPLVRSQANWFTAACRFAKTHNLGGIYFWGAFLAFNSGNLLTQPAYAAAYLGFMIIVALHVRHGFWSAFQTLGLNHPKYMPAIQVISVVFGVVVAVGFGSLPILVVMGGLG